VFRCCFAEPVLQPGETLESLSKVRISTTLQTAVSAEEVALIAELDQAEIAEVNPETAPEKAAPMTVVTSEAVADEQVIGELDQPELS
jgi:hypothetical protein